MRVLSLSVAVVCGALLFPPSAAALPAVGVTSGSPPAVVVFDTATPGTLTSGPVTVTGLGATERIVGVDFRPANAVLYAVVRDTDTSEARLATLDPLTGATAAVGSGFGALGSDNVGVDFNPVPDRLRVTTSTDQNLRVNPDTGELAVTDSPLSFAAGDVNVGDNPNATAVAYTNNFPGATTTTLYDIEFGNKVLATQSPPNQGFLNTVGSFGLGDSLAVAGFDIAEGGGLAFVTITSPAFPDESFLYSVDLQSGGMGIVAGIAGGARMPGFSIAPVSRFSVADTAAAEDAGSMVVTVDRGHALGATSVSYATAAATATEGADFTATSGTLAFAQGERTAQITIPLIDDEAVEGDTNETLRVLLSGPGANGRIADVDGTLAIVDDDVPPGPVAAPVPPEDKPPAVKLMAPASGAALSAFSPAQVTAEASDDRGVDRVVFMRGARVLATDTTAPYSAAYAPTAADVGSSSLIAIAIDTAGQSATAVLDVKVTRVKPVFTAATTPRRDARNPRVFTTAGSVGLPAGADKAAACAGGRVTVRFLSGKRTISSRMVKVAADCTFRSRVSFTLSRSQSRRSLSVRTEFGGTPSVEPGSARGTVSVR